ncbi:cytochrome c biogenesis CcdA family protein [Acidovorax sp.]|uniref:cytochrome c biogenesis CcdA family protein n=1 Tax=Acidovorax sp. TaxID=1872122 RepID=UPI002603F22F|nr:cytochrome c biogenesis CcdA family protein [Acidovorax sp.]
MTTPLLALGAGMLTVAAPCVLPMLPVVLGASVGGQRTWRPVFIALGFALSFAAMALVFSAFTQVLGLSHETLRQGAAVLLLCFGAAMVWPPLFHGIAQRASGLLGGLANVSLPGSAMHTPAGGLLLGITLGAVWTPCAGPVLASILTVIATEPTTLGVATLLLAYSVGAAIPMLLIAYGGQWATGWARRVAGRLALVQQISGVVVMAVALAMLMGWDTELALWLG